tara:strand:- start:50 stop:595 length:546 start_codon:yes stop_codon:yes gene_type:complete
MGSDIDDIDNMIKKYIYESPDGGKTVYQRPFGAPHEERELVPSQEERDKMDDKELMRLAHEYKELCDDDDDMTFELDTSNSLYGLDTTNTITMSSMPSMGMTHSFSSSAAHTLTIGDDYMDPGDDPIEEMEKRLTAIEDRLKILKPDPNKLKEYKILEGLYEQYKAAEALLNAPGPGDKNE